LVVLTVTSGPVGEADSGRSWCWHLNRVLALFLAVLVPLHFAVVIIGGDVGRTTAAGVTTRFANTTWRGLAWFLVIFGLTHAWLSWSEARAAQGRGSEIRAGGGRVVPVAVAAAGGALMLAATYVLFTYR
jgi:succinate dehydrogenase hydrophobic anchor subunit